MSTPSGLGLSDSDEDETATSIVPSGSVTGSTPAGLGLSDSDDDHNATPATASTAEPIKSLIRNDAGADLGLSDSDDDETAAIGSSLVAERSNPGSDGNASVPEGLGLSDSDEEGGGNSAGQSIISVANEPNHSGENKAKISTVLGLSDSEDEEDKITDRPMVGDTDGLEISDEDDSTLTRQRGFNQMENETSVREVVTRTRDPESHVFNIPTLPRPLPATTTFVAKIPPQLGAEAEEFTPRHTATELDAKIRHLESLGDADVQAAIDRADDERDAAKQFIAQSGGFQNHILWRFQRDETGEIVKDTDGMAMRYVLYCTIMYMHLLLTVSVDTISDLKHLQNSALRQGKQYASYKMV